MKHAVGALVLLVLANLMISPSVAGEVAIVLRLADSPGDGSVEWRFAVVPNTLVVHELELGDSVEGAAVELDDAGEWCGSCRVQVNYETSVTIMNEGPHLDLLDWKHYRSEWTDLVRDDEGGWRVPTFTSDERFRFPEFSVIELRDAILEVGDEHWARSVEGISRLGEYPSGVDISIIRLRIVRSTAEKTEALFTIEFHIPMGC